MLFSRKKALRPLFKGFSDCHCHILPGVDDGFASEEKSMDILRLYAELGVSAVWFTPHVMEDVPNSTSFLKERYEAFLLKAKAEIEGLPEIHLSSENMLDDLFEKRLADKDFLSYVDGHLLVETSYFNPPENMATLLRGVKAKGYYPVLAHPERYLYMGKDEYHALLKGGIRFQLNIFSLCGLYGDTVRQKAEGLLKEGLYSFCGTDLHRRRTFEKYVDYKVDAKIYSLLDNLMHSVPCQKI